MTCAKAKSNSAQPVFIFHRFLRKAMMNRGVGFKELSQESGVNIKTLYGWASGVKPRDLIQVYSVAKVLNLTIEELMFGFQFEQQNHSYELVLYRISADQLREKILSVPKV